VSSGLVAPLLWGFWRLRGLQRALAKTLGGYYEGDEWGFGQVMAITIFVPIFVEMLFVWIREGGDVGDDGDEGGVVSAPRDDAAVAAGSMGAHVRFEKTWRKRSDRIYTL